MFCDYFPLNHALVSVNVPGLAAYRGVQGNGGFTRFLEGLSCLFYSIKRRPMIRYSATKSTSTLLFAKELNVSEIIGFELITTFG